MYALVCLQYFDTVGSFVRIGVKAAKNIPQMQFLLRSLQGDHLSGKPGNVREFEAGGQGSLCNHHSVADLSWQHGGSMPSLVGWVTGRSSDLEKCLSFKTPYVRIKGGTG